MASSFCLEAARASNRLATLTQQMSRTAATQRPRHASFTSDRAVAPPNDPRRRFHRVAMIEDVDTDDGRIVHFSVWKEDP